MKKPQLINCIEMVTEYLRRKGYDGLVSHDRECGCALEDLMPCGGECAMDCEAAHNVDGCTPECGEGCDWHMVPGKREVAK